MGAWRGSKKRFWMSYMDQHMDHYLRNDRNSYDLDKIPYEERDIDGNVISEGRKRPEIR